MEKELKGFQVQKRIIRKKLRSFRNKLEGHQDWWDCLDFNQKHYAYTMWLRFVSTAKRDGKKAKIKYYIDYAKRKVVPRRTRKRDILINKLVND